MLQHALHAGTGGVWGHAPPEKILKIDAKIVQFRDIPHKITPVDITIIATACVNGKVLIGSNNHVMHILTISGNSKARGSTA